ncbi:unnamed protein product [Scytosiphon promiscuus]
MQKNSAAATAVQSATYLPTPTRQLSGCTLARAAPRPGPCSQSITGWVKTLRKLSSSPSAFLCAKVKALSFGGVPASNLLAALLPARAPRDYAHRRFSRSSVRWISLSYLYPQK